MAFTLPELGYAYDALEPNIDARTMEIHHTKHHQAYITNLNNAIKDTDLDSKSIEEIIKGMDMTAMPIRNNGGGHWNHTFFWEIINPDGNSSISDELSSAIDKAFGSMDVMKEKFAAAAMTRFGSGWAWLCAHADGTVEICSTPNQDNPMMPSTGCGGAPIAGLDVWEHAYYLNYQNRRADYVTAFWNIVNWSVVSAKYAEATK